MLPGAVAVACDGLLFPLNRRLEKPAGIGCVLEAMTSLLLVHPASQRTVPGP